MGKIDKYPYDLDVSDKDIILGSDIENGLKTKNFKMLNIKNYMLKDIKDIVHNGFTSKAYAIWSGSGLIFDVVYPNYYIEGVLYEGKTEQLTLYPADATNPRIDIIAVDITGAIQINGTPQASPFAPIYDEDTQLKIVNVLVNANATTPANIVEEVIYKENVEWSTSSTVPSVDFNAIDAYQGNKCIKINGFDAGQYIRFTDSVTNQTTDYDVVKFFIRLESKFIATDKILINFYNDTDKTATLVVSKSKYFFDIDKIGTYQAIIVPLTDFTFLSTTFNKFEISYLGETINSSIWFDNISLLKTDIINDNIDVSNLVPYTGATSDVDLGEFQLKTGQIEFDQTPTGTFGVGKVRWNDTDGTIEVMLKGGSVTLQLGQEQVLRVVNKTGSNLLESEYHCVYISGAQGNRLKVDLALSNNTLNSNKTIGLVTENINNNLEGFVTTVGLVRGINTTGSLQGETWADGDVLYLSAVSAGSLTNVAPTTPNHKVVVGYIVRAHITQGSIFVKVDTGLAITELHDVNITATTANKVIGSTTEGLWENKTIAQVLEYTPANINSPTFTGIPSAPTATVGTNTTQLATTAFVLANASGISLSANNIWSGIQTYLNGKLGLRNVADTFTSFFTNTNTASRTYTLPNKSMTIGDVTTDTDQDISGIKNFTSDIKLSNYPNTRNDGALTSNKILSTDVNGNLKLYTMAVMPAPFLEILIPDSTLPSTTTNFVLKGAFFTPTMTVVIAGQTINYLTFISDNEVRVNVTTSAVEGFYAVTLNNGIEVVFLNALLIVLGDVFSPVEAEWTNVVPPINIREYGNAKIGIWDSVQWAKWTKVLDYTQNFSIIWNVAASPYGANIQSGGIQQISIRKVSDGSEVFGFRVVQEYGDVQNYLTSSTDGYLSLLNSDEISYWNNINTRNWEFRWYNGVLYGYLNNVLKVTSALNLTENMNIVVNLKRFDITNIKYIELAS